MPFEKGQSGNPLGRPPGASAADAASVLAAITAAVAAGELTPAEAGELFKLVEGYARMFEVATFSHSLARLKAEPDSKGAPNT